jgi:hypothetical protein
VKRTFVPIAAGVVWLLFLALVLASGSRQWSQSSQVPADAARQRAEKRIQAMLYDSGGINHPDLTFSCYAREVRGNQLSDVVFKRKDAEGHVAWVVYARQGSLQVDSVKEQLVINLRCGDALGQDGSRARFDDRTWEIPLPESFFE